MCDRQTSLSIRTQKNSPRLYLAYIRSSLNICSLAEKSIYIKNPHVLEDIFVTKIKKSKHLYVVKSSVTMSCKKKTEPDISSHQILEAINSIIAEFGYNF